MGKKKNYSNTAVASLSIAIVAIFSIFYLTASIISTTSAMTNTNTSSCSTVTYAFSQYSSCTTSCSSCVGGGGGGGGGCCTTTKVNTSSSDYTLWVAPYLSQLEKIRQVLMSNYSQASGTYGYYTAIDQTCGGNIEASPAIGISAGNNNVCVAIDNNLEGSYSLDFFNSANSPLVNQSGFKIDSTNIYGTARDLISQHTWYGVGFCTAPFTPYTYPTSFGGYYERTEAEYGFPGPYALALVNPTTTETVNGINYAIHLGGIGSTNCPIPASYTGSSTTNLGQQWWLPNYGGFTGSAGSNFCSNQPCIVTEFPSKNPVSPTSGLETSSFAIDELYMQCIAGTVSCTLWQNAYHSIMPQYPFPQPRQALHFIQLTRATQAWTYSNSTFSSGGLTSEEMLQNAINDVFSNAVGSDGGLCQSFGNCNHNDNTPEPNFEAMIAFDPRMPSWFTLSTCQQFGVCQ